mmetsp:Transcript_14318/g.44831  ORF Transcript_14318/g.44831 Transcript_14318/m.44831 type:complete len:363 (-) Transcript_14318:328-1416(-)
MDAAGNLPGGIEARDRLAIAADNTPVRAYLEAAGAIVNHWRDSRSKEGLRPHGRAADRVPEEPLTGTGLAAGLIPGPATGKGRPWSLIRIRLRLCGSLVVRLMHGFKLGQRNAEMPRQALASLETTHEAAPNVELALLLRLVRSGFVQHQREGRPALPHLTCDVVVPAKLVHKAVAVAIEQQTPHTAEHLRGQELDLGLGIVWLHEACGVHLHTVKVDGPGTCGLTKPYAVACATFAVRRGQVQEVRAVPCQQRLRRKVCPVAASSQDHRSMLPKDGPVLLISQASARPRAVCQQLGGERIRYDLRPARLFGDPLHHAQHGRCDGHPRGLSLPTVGPGLAVPTKLRDDREVDVEGLPQPADT